jgi:hypothetical protein
VVEGDLHDLLDGVALDGLAEREPAAEGEHGHAEARAPKLAERHVLRVVLRHVCCWQWKNGDERGEMGRWVVIVTALWETRASSMTTAAGIARERWACARSAGHGRHRD